MWRVKLLLSMFPLLAESALPEPSLAATTSPESPSPEPAPTIGLLYPFETESRDVRSLDGLWQFYRTTEPNPMQGVTDEWFKQDLEQIKPTIPMPVPASYNDINTDPQLRDHVGTVWYQRKFFLSRYWASSNQRIWLRFGSVHYSAIVWLNGEEVMRHSIGHLPFEAEITAYAKYGSENRLTVMCDNTLLNITIPQGQVHTENTDTGQSLVQTYTFDFFNYAGIQRSVHLYTTPETYIQDIHLVPNLDDTNQTGTIQYTILANGAASDVPLKLHLQLRDRANELVVSNFSSDVGDSVFSGEIVVNNANPWWPYLMHDKPGYLYTLELYLHAHDERLLDVYRMQVGIRTLAWSNESIFLNGKPLYLRGFGRHEDSDIRGKGFDLPLLLRDFSLIKWMGANAYRTSHYPYSEESMQQADREGIMVIDECSAVNIDIYGAALLANHKSAIEQLVHRDRNHASVIMWSIANEPRSANKLAADYFEHLVNFTKTLDFTRPLTAAINVEIEKDHLAQFLDVISFNRYNAWYHNSGRLDMITKNVIDEATAWHTKYNKPIVMTEYGADTMEGLHLLPSYVWSEEFQNDLLSQHFKAFDNLRLQNWFAGEFVWNFADFKTEQTYTRVGGNKKGLFTRNRQPKASAFLLRKRYYALAMELDEIKDPINVFEYYIYWAEYKESTDSDNDSHTEL